MSLPWLWTALLMSGHGGRPTWVPSQQVCLVSETGFVGSGG
jgi:hypothetical protein